MARPIAEGACGAQIGQGRATAQNEGALMMAARQVTDMLRTARGINDRLENFRSRVLGENQAESPPKEPAQVAPVRSSIDELESEMSRLLVALNQISDQVASIERL